MWDCTHFFCVDSSENQFQEFIMSHDQFCFHAQHDQFRFCHSVFYSLLTRMSVTSSSRSLTIVRLSSDRISEVFRYFGTWYRYTPVFLPDCPEKKNCKRHALSWYTTLKSDKGSQDRGTPKIWVDSHKFEWFGPRLGLWQGYRAFPVLYPWHQACFPSKVFHPLPRTCFSKNIKIEMSTRSHMYEESLILTWWFCMLQTRIENRVWASMRLFVVICCYPQVPWSKIETEPTTCLTHKGDHSTDRLKKTGFLFLSGNTDWQRFFSMARCNFFFWFCSPFKNNKLMMVTGETQRRPVTYAQTRTTHTHVS